MRIAAGLEVEQLQRLLDRIGARQGGVGRERHVLLARGLAHGRDDLAVDAHGREAHEGVPLARPKVADGLVQADQPLLQQILALGAVQEVRLAALVDQRPELAQELALRTAVARLRACDEWLLR